jgi:putative lipoprotein (rSAM/lipoprotein system)
MRNVTRFITGLLTIAAVSACSSAYDMESRLPMGNIRGVVKDSDGEPLNHIKVTVGYGEGISPMTVYTSMKGEFIADLDPSATMLTVTLEDIDGEENGGLFETLTDQITIIWDDFSDEAEMISLEYCLTRATASESSLQSL